MAIHIIRPIRLKQISGKNYRCDLCGASFKYKHDAKAHHISEHTSDKVVLDKMVGKWYKLGVKDIYTRIVQFDYQQNRVMLFRFTIENISASLCNNGVYFNISMNNKYISINNFKKEFIYDSVWKPQWEEVDAESAHSALDKATKYMFDRLAIEDKA